MLYNMGSVFEIKHSSMTFTEWYILARVEKNTYCLISLSSGNRWNDPKNIGDKDIDKRILVDTLVNNDEVEVRYVPPEEYLNISDETDN